MSQAQCPRCGGAFDCGALNTSQPCWCVALPRLPLEELGRRHAGCYCPACLQGRLQEVKRPTERGAL